ncbi:MAG: DUF3800 domain-containing protein [bacterium]
MYLIYFDENKYSEDNPFFFLGGVLIKDKKITKCETDLMKIQYKFLKDYLLKKETELHGHEIFQGKGNFKGKVLQERMDLFTDVVEFIIKNKIPVIIVCIDVKQHKKKYGNPRKEYELGFMFLLEQFCSFLDSDIDGNTLESEIGIVFADYEKDEMAKSVLSFSQYKKNKKTDYIFGRNITALKDTVYYIDSHHSRFLQLADMIIFIASRYRKMEDISDDNLKWPDKIIRELWNLIKNSGLLQIKKWP